MQHYGVRVKILWLGMGGNVSEWSNMSTRGLLFQWALQLCLLVSSRFLCRLRNLIFILYNYLIFLKILFKTYTTCIFWLNLSDQYSPPENVNTLTAAQEGKYSTLLKLSEALHDLKVTIWLMLLRHFLKTNCTKF